MVCAVGACCVQIREYPVAWIVASRVAAFERLHDQHIQILENATERTRTLRKNTLERLWNAC
jgi:hypothetical protein